MKCLIRIINRVLTGAVVHDLVDSLILRSGKYILAENQEVGFRVFIQVQDTLRIVIVDVRCQEVLEFLRVVTADKLLAQRIHRDRVQQVSRDDEIRRHRSDRKHNIRSLRFRAHQGMTGTQHLNTVFFVNGHNQFGLAVSRVLDGRGRSADSDVGDGSGQRVTANVAAFNGVDDQITQR